MSSWSDLAETPLSSVMNSIVMTVPPGTTVREAARFLIQHNLGSLVVEEPGDISGIFTEKDLCRVIDGGHDPITTPVREYVSAPIIKKAPTTTIIEGMETMARREIRHLPIMDSGNALVGIVSDRDILHQISVVVDLLKLTTALEQGKAPGQIRLQDPALVPVIGDGRAINISHPLVYLGLERNLHQAASRLLRVRTECVFLHDAGESSIFTPRDLTVAVADGADLDQDITNWTQHPLITCDPATTITEVGRQMVNRQLRHLIVADSGGPKAVISDRQLVTLFPEFVRIWRSRITS